MYVHICVYVTFFGIAAYFITQGMLHLSWKWTLCVQFYSNTALAMFNWQTSWHLKILWLYVKRLHVLRELFIGLVFHMPEVSRHWWPILLARQELSSTSSEETKVRAHIITSCDVAHTSLILQLSAASTNTNHLHQCH